MRTTLKKALGRELDGNGNGVLPPGSLTPVTLYKQPPPPRPGVAKVIGKFLFLLATAVLVLVVGLVGGFYLWAHESAAALRCQTTGCKRGAAHLDPLPKDPHQPAIALVVGYDHRAGDGSAPSRSDTMMLIRADPSTKTISLLSLPRDLVVPIYCPSRTATGRNGPAVASGSGRINEAYAFCGPTGSIETVKHLTGLPINYLITVNFLGFIAVVNKIGGVWMDVDRRYYNRNVGTISTNYANIDLQPGYQLLNGREALSFVRYRHTDSDLFRLARQQEFVSALREQAARSLGVRSVISLVNTIAEHRYVEIGIGGHRQFDLGTVRSYAAFAHGLPPGHVFQNRLQDLTGYNELYASPSSVQNAVQSFLNPDVQASKTQTAVALGRKLHHKFVLPPSKVTLTVLNGNGRAGSAGNASYLLAQKGYKVVLPPSNQTANAPTWNYFHSKAYFDPKRGACKGAAQALAKLVGSTDVEQIPANIVPLSNGACVVLVVGSTFHDSLAPVAVPQLPTRQPPFIRFDPGASRSALAAVKRRLPFQAQLPTVIERNSRLDSGYGETPVRVYSLGGQPTVRLTYTTGAPGEYWGIQETRWTGAPVLSDRSLTQRVGGRHFDLYYNGSNLHLVVLRSGGATYWVMNTLVDSLSNETMLAIARGLRPMSR